MNADKIHIKNDKTHRYLGSFCSKVCCFLFDYININHFWMYIIMKSQELVKSTLLKQK